tara:strand:- start:3690 stop:5573 length:1884 start_codon:yes stop_codon:yes gene_type:complete
MQTRHAPKAVSYLFGQLTPYQINAQHAKYTAPFQLTLEDVVVARQEQEFKIPKLTLWLSPSFWQEGKLALDSLLIEGATLDLNQSDASVFDSVYLHQLAFKHVDISANNWSAREVSLQVEQPRWLSKNQTLPYGDIQFSAKQLYVRGEALNDVLVDAQYQAQDSTIYGASFKWHGAEVSGQAEQFAQGWSLINVTIFNLNLDSTAPANQLVSTLRSLDFPVYHINSLDILRSQVNYQGWNFEQLDASLENLYFNRSLWQQEQGYFSFDAERLAYQELEFISPTAQLGFTKNGVNIDLFNADFKEGWVQVKGELSPSNVALDEVRLSNVKWLEGLTQVGNDIAMMSASLQSLTIDELEVRNSQFIQVEHRPYWQLSGLSIEGKNLELINQKQLGLLNGELEISANNGSFDNLLSTQLVVEMQAEQGKLNLNRAFLPLQTGYIEANGQWDRSTISAPWKLVVHADGVPTDLPLLEAQLPFSLQGMAEIELELSGLSGDYAMFAHSLSGKAQLQLHQTTLSAKSADGETSFVQRWPLEQITINADRGRLEIGSKSERAELTGSIDMIKPEFATLLFNSQSSCQRLWSDIFSLTNVIEQICSTQKVTPPAITDGENNQEAAGSESSDKTAL